jgi:hypothetical protein
MSDTGPERARGGQTHRARDPDQLEDVTPSERASVQVRLPSKRSWLRRL